MIPRLRWTPTGAGFFGFVRVDGCRDSTALAEAVLEQAHLPAELLAKEQRHDALARDLAA